MTTQQLHAILGDISDSCIAEAEAFQVKPQKWGKKILLSAAAIAACMLILISPFAFMRAGSAAPEAADQSIAADAAPTPQAPAQAAPVPDPVPAPESAPNAGSSHHYATTGDGPASDKNTTADGRMDGYFPHIDLVNEQGDTVQYYISGHLETTSLTLPEGFSHAGDHEMGPYYTNPAHPHWVYVQQTVNQTVTNGQIYPIEPQTGYVLYVEYWLRQSDLLSIDGQLYRGLWSPGEYADYADTVTQEQYDRLLNKYGKIIRADKVDGFTLLGAAAFSGYDTIPEGALCANVPDAQVYGNPDEPQVALVKGTWSWRGGTEPCYYVYLAFEAPIE